MPRIFDNIEQSLLPALRETLSVAERADFCVGYFNLRGWHHLAEYVDRWAGGDGSCCRLLIGMQRTASEELRRALRAGADDGALDHQTAIREKGRIAQEFREQLTLGVPTNDDESVLRRLAGQIRERKLIVKVYLRHPLHAKLYLLYRPDPTNPIVGYLGSSNLTLAGLSHQGELNVDVLDSDATGKLAAWFEDRWRDRWCLDISKELADIIDQSWAGDHLVPPYHVYLKMAYHLAQEARSGLAEFRIPSVFGSTLFDFQVAAVKIAAHHLHKRGGVLIGDVVGLGKSIMATALAKVFEEDFHTETLIICPKNLVPMWKDYVHTYRLYAKVLSISRVIRKQKPSSTVRCSSTCKPATKEEILKGAKPGKVSSSRQYGKPGGFGQANKDFDALTRGGKIQERGGGLRTAEMPDGSKVIVRPNSSGGQPTLEIQPLSGKTIKIRYE